jgi:hypothetical protein
VKRIAGTAEIHEQFALTDKGTLRAVASAPPAIPTCAIEVELTAPYRVKKLGCLPDKEQTMSCVLSPKGAWFACETVSATGPEAAGRPTPTWIVREAVTAETRCCTRRRLAATLAEAREHYQVATIGQLSRASNDGAPATTGAATAVAAA